jgi:hemolysin activation/secretion protein
LILQKTVPKVEIEQGNTPAVPSSDNLKIIVQSLKINGSQSYTHEQLLAVIGFLPWSALTLADLRGMAAKIADHYHRNNDYVTSAPLENRLLFLSEIPGVMIKSTLVLNASLGASDLIVDVIPG